MIRSIILAVLIALTCSLIYFLPGLKQTPSALDLEIPSFLGVWATETHPPSEKELKVLAKDTDFSQARCTLPRVEEGYYAPGRYRTDAIELSIVLSGYDLANSIHRPERCMAAQGFRGLLASDDKLKLSNGQVIPLTQIDSYRDIQVGRGKDREVITLNFLSYYFFVGHDEITADHTERTLIDIYDRVAKGESQRWAFVMAHLPYTTNEDRKYGDTLLDKKGAEKKIHQLLSELAQSNIDWDQVNH